MASYTQSEYERYDDVPILRRRWVFVLSVLFFIPLAVVMAASGEIYAYQKGKVLKYPKSLRMGMVVFWLAMIALAVVQIAGI